MVSVNHEHAAFRFCNVMSFSTSEYLFYLSKSYDVLYRLEIIENVRILVQVLHCTRFNLTVYEISTIDSGTKIYYMLGIPYTLSI